MSEENILQIKPQKNTVNILFFYRKAAQLLNTNIIVYVIVFTKKALPFPSKNKD